MLVCVENVYKMLNFHWLLAWLVIGVSYLPWHFKKLMIFSIGYKVEETKVVIEP